MRVQIHVELAAKDGERLRRVLQRKLKTNGNPLSRAEYGRQAILAALDRDEQSGPAATASGGLAGPGPAAGKRK